MFSNLISSKFPDITVVIIYVVNFILSLSIVTTLFAMMFKFLPDTEIEWRDVWIGALFTSFLFAIGKFLLGLYFGKSEPGSAYGAAGTVVLIMLWISYSCMILFFGAEFTRQHALLNKEEMDADEKAEEDSVIEKA